VPGAGDGSRVLRFFEACGVTQVLFGLDSPTVFGLEVRKVRGSWRGRSSGRRCSWLWIRDSGVPRDVGVEGPVSRSSDGRLVEAVGGEVSGCSSLLGSLPSGGGTGDAGRPGSSGWRSKGGVASRPGAFAFAGVFLGLSGPLVPRTRGSRDEGLSGSRVGRLLAFGVERSGCHELGARGVRGPGWKMLVLFGATAAEALTSCADGFGADGPRFELRATRSLEFEYAEALRAGGAEDFGVPGATGFGTERSGCSSERSLRAGSGPAGLGLSRCDAPRAHGV
jgi:hypothetical protein